jgi:hypothetical protein
MVVLQNNADIIKLTSRQASRMTDKPEQIVYKNCTISYSNQERNCRTVPFLLGVFLPNGGYDSFLGYYVVARSSLPDPRTGDIFTIWYEWFRKTDDLDEMKRKLNEAITTCKQYIDKYLEITTPLSNFDKEMAVSFKAGEGE